MSSDPAFRVQVQTVAVVVRCRGFEPFEARVAHVGQCDPAAAVRDTLANSETFVAVADPVTGQIRLLSKAHIHVLELPCAGKASESMLALLPSDLQEIRVRLLDATVVSGQLAVAGPVGRTRVSDELNRGPCFVELFTDDSLLFVNRDAIVMVWDTPAA